MYTCIYVYMCVYIYIHIYIYIYIYICGTWWIEHARLRLPLHRRFRLLHHATYFK